MNFFVIVSGPTGVGKTDLVDRLCTQLSFPVEIINADMGQLYTPLSIGTAKPSLRQVLVKHHLFDILNEPRSYTVSEWRSSVLSVMNDLWKRKVVPVIVGGSNFYLSSLFFPPQGMAVEKPLPDSWSKMTSYELWQELHTIDPVRAAALHPHDRYRIERALLLWLAHGRLPSDLSPEFSPPGKCVYYYLMRNKDNLHERIASRLHIMMEQGWLSEVEGLDRAWWDFLEKKKVDRVS